MTSAIGFRTLAFLLEYCNFCLPYETYEYLFHNVVPELQPTLPAYGIYE